MNSSLYEREREVAIRAVREAAGLCRAVRGRVAPEVMAKGDLSPVTVADFGSQALICRVLLEAFPDDLVVAEEDSAELRSPDGAAMRDEVARRVAEVRPGTDADEVCRWIDHGSATVSGALGRFWTLDPIDGTKGFLRGEQYAVALALVVDGQVEVAALACPNLPHDPRHPETLGAIFAAERARGAVALPLDGDGPGVAVRVSPCDDPAAARLCEPVESGHSAHGASAAVATRLGITAPPARLDSQAKYAVVARGEAEIYLRMPTRADYREKIWDHAAGLLVVEEAGGVVTDIDGKPLEFTHGRELVTNRGVVVTNGRLHHKVLEALETSS